MSEPSQPIIDLSTLLSRPNDYNGERVRVRGVIAVEFERKALYATKEDLLSGEKRPAVWLSFRPTNPAALHGQCVIVEGVFDSAARGHLGMWAGTIQQPQVTVAMTGA
jgi:hypothetical protein